MCAPSINFISLCFFCNLILVKAGNILIEAQNGRFIIRLMELGSIFKPSRTQENIEYSKTFKSTWDEQNITAKDFLLRT